MSIQVVKDTEAVTYFIVGYSHITQSFFISTEKTAEHFGDCNTEVFDENFMDTPSEWTDLGEDEINNLAIDLEQMIGE
jgi:hypothetical protein